MQPVEIWSDSFGNLQARGERSRVDIISTTDYNSERLKKITSGNVDKDAQFSDEKNHWQISTTGSTDDRFRLESHERIRYTPNFEALMGVSCQFQNDLDEGDQVLLGMSDNNLPSDDGWQFVFQGNTDIKCRIRNGGSTVREINANVPPDFSPKNPFIARIKYNWYGVGKCQFILTYTVPENGELGDVQKNKVIAELSNNDDWLSEAATLHIVSDVAVTDSNNSTGKTIEIGSMGASIEGDVKSTTRSKKINGFDLGGSIESTSWTPIKAYRIDPNRDNIYVELDSIQAVPSDTMKIAAYAMDASNTDASSFSTGDEVLSDNSVVETTTNLTTPTSPTGRQIGLLATTGGNQKTASPDEQTTITPIYDDDVMVIMARTKSASNADVDMTTKFNEEW